MQHSRNKVKSAFIWNALDSFGSQAIGLIVGLTLANLLGPNAYGLIAMLAVFISISSVFVSGGLGSAITRKKNRNESDFATTFFFSLGISIISYVLLFILAPYVADFYSEPRLTLLMRVIALTIIINVFTVIPRVLLSVSLNFKAQSKCNITALIFSSVVAFIFAYYSYGVWALVAQQITSAFISAIMFNIMSPWLPKAPFCKKAFNDLFGFGSKLLLASLLDSIYNNLYGVIIGKQYSSAQLGVFNHAKILSSTPAAVITGVILNVTYPMLSNIRCINTLDKTYILILKVSAFIIFPIMFGICIIAKPLIAIILGPEWQNAAVLISIMSMGFITQPISSINRNMLNVKGRSDIYLRLEVIHKVCVTLMLVLVSHLGVIAMCVGMVVTSYLSLALNIFYTGKLSSIKPAVQFKVILSIGFISAFSALIGYTFSQNIERELLKIITMLMVALATYLMIMIIFNRSLLIEIKKVLMSPKQQG
ncbi:lipopolysaccharide biosynthesis protein [Pseudoalteromonas sp. 2CM36K]|uniref:lipopolysaccharide biosynthesis protein n=1 Tax=Pseudoalteromonas sp. 2CM36K TaxID=2929854 RepID=UPI0020C05D22|nr:lipopolysaccharide biosynthesis protein [Pseudoalteromonas sp. 2CM36K]MCK8104707.1 lipopolysaccharide biosynthesis protein [Pseudoalteromonas sp. 2CM36K]